jgi:hypothetical protein
MLGAMWDGVVEAVGIGLLHNPVGHDKPASYGVPDLHANAGNAPRALDDPGGLKPV